MHPSPVSIPFSKGKIFIWLIGALAFVTAGCWLLINPPRSGNALFDNPWLTKTVRAASFIFFGIALYFFIRKLMATGPGLVIDDTGIEDFSMAASASKIYWKDIEAIEVLTIKSQPLILFKVNNPQAYIDGQSNKFKRKMLELNYKWYGAPVGISANGLNISFEELLQLVSENFEAYKN